ncbi:phosphate/phosphite/phosphonate ABC transporter substrate-binding protein [Paenibacillus guangzhouensis]|uniref:phosphate/phosphite/phosphonate ABC transporter substrate-binding protein n=1 Tax=Paenibacillus guangzhouensis TaxID=1473112 RepID=UPI001266DDBB|nr:phosphate/phosphite/phosphonate ABC transporter substrate-binding protein [Paenibacillus guangzhouensis]
MMKKTMAIVMTMLIAASLAACGSKDSSASYVPKELNVQFVPSQNADTLESKTKPLEKLLGDRLGIPVHVTVSPDYNTIVEAMSSKQVDVGFLPPNAYVLAHDNKKAADLLLQAQRFGVEDATGKATTEKVDFYKAMIVVPKDSPIKTLEDLKGKKIGWQNVTSSAGYVYPAAELKKAGVDPDKDVTGITIKGHDAALMALLNGQVDAVANFQDARNTVLNDVPDIFEKTRVLHYTAKIPNDTVCVRNDMDQSWRDKISQAFIDITNDAEGAKIIKDIYTHVGYVKGDDNNFDSVREYAKAVGQEIK